MAGAPVSMAENALLMVHNPSGLCAGNSGDMRELADMLDKVRGSLTSAYERKTGKTTEEIGAMMDAETWMTAQEALAAGFIDEITGELKMAASIKAWCDIYKPRLVCFDKYATQTIADRLANSGVVVEDVSGQQFYKACGDLLEGLVNHRVVHNGQAEFIQQMNNCAAKVNDSAWRIIKRKSAGDISAPIGIAMAVSKLMIPQPKPQIYG